VGFTIVNVDFASATDVHKTEIKQNVAATIASEISGVAPSDVTVVLSAGSVKVDATISASNLSVTATEINDKAVALKSSIVTSVSSVAGLPTSGAISIASIQAEVRQAPTLAPSASDSTTTMPPAPAPVIASASKVAARAPTSMNLLCCMLAALAGPVSRHSS
jgi:hypothetical protein